MKISILKMIRAMFSEKDKLTLSEMYNELSKNPNLDWPEKILRHRIRSTIYSLKKTGEIKRIGDATYKSA